MRSFVGSRSLGLLGAGARVSDYEHRRQEDEASLQPALPQQPAVDPMYLTPIQQAALLMMSESQVKRAVIGRLLEDAQDAPSMHDFRALARCGLARYSPGKRLHELTDAGRTAVRIMQEALCKRLNIHLLLGPFGGGPTVSFKCPCGWHTSVRNSHTASGNARASWNRHVSTEEGMSKLFVALTAPERMEG